MDLKPRRASTLRGAPKCRRRSLSSHLSRTSGAEEATTRKRGKRGQPRQIRRQIEAIQKQLSSHPRLGQTTLRLEAELESLCSDLERLTGPESSAEKISAHQLRARAPRNERVRPARDSEMKYAQPRAGESRPVEDLALMLVEPKRRPANLTRTYK